MNVWRDILKLHSLHEEECNICSARRSHRRHRRPEYDNVLLDTHLRHFVQELKTLTILQTFLTCTYSTEIRTWGVKKIKMNEINNAP